MDVYQHLCMTGDFNATKQAIMGELRRAMAAIRHLGPGQEVLVMDELQPTYEMLTQAMKYSAGMGELGQVQWLIEGPLVLIESFLLTQFSGNRRTLLHDFLIPSRRRLALLGELYAVDVRDYHIADYLNGRERVPTMTLPIVTHAMQLTMQ